MAAEDEPLPPVPPPPEQPWEIIGTVSDPNIKKLDNVARIIPKENCLATVLTCGAVIWDVSYDREELRVALEYMKLLKELLDKSAPNPTTPTDDDGGAGESKKRYLILISTVMTWACTKPLDPESTDLPFIESDFRKRKPHPNYKLHYECENEVVSIARNYRAQIGATVVAAGLTYGGKEDALFYLFQKAWECERFLPILGRGNNVIPLINVFDLAKVILNLLLDFPKKLYILAVEQTITKQREIVKSLGRIVGTGMFRCIPPEDAFLIPEIDQRIHDLMTLNLNMEPTFLPETMNLEWTSELTFAENVPALMKQFKKERQLRAFKIVVYGPPLVGKTTLSKKICENYGLMYVSPETIVQDTIEDLDWRIGHWDSGGELLALGLPIGEDEEPVVDDDDTGEEEGVIENAKATLAILRSGRPISEEDIILYLRQRLLSHEATNKGWVLDAFPTSLMQCTALFERGEEEDVVEEEEQNKEEKFEEDLDLYNNVLKKMLPDLVVSLEATDDFICDKAMKQPDCESRLDEEIMLKRLSDFRSGDTRDLTPLNFFDELDIHPLVLQVKDHHDYAMKKVYKEVALRMGRPCRYAKLQAILDKVLKEEKDEKETIRLQEEKTLRELEKKLREEREEKMEYWSELYSILREEEEAALAAAGEPMRNYLMSHIFPTLTPALLEVAKLRPDDPIDFLAEYLFKLNPTGKMLEPGFNLQAELLLGRVKIVDEALKDLDIQIEPLLPPELEFKNKEEKVKFNKMTNF
ncbi:hypothetical protein O0L34_g16290 [Tuta absoluta]|nr:hypothetical protein O0L34_g16290 [Tuta absoluta]